MKNIITASIEFSFKGERFSPSITIELDEYLQSGKSLPNLYALIATANNIDHYSYEYEMMQAEPINIIQAEGMVADFVDNGSLNLDAFVTAWKQQKIIEDLQRIVEKNMGISELHLHPELKQTLLEIYRLAESRSTN